MKATQGEQSLMAIEKALVAAVETSGLVQVSADYENDREVRQGAEDARKQGISSGEDNYITKVSHLLKSPLTAGLSKGGVL